MSLHLGIQAVYLHHAMRNLARLSLLSGEKKNLWVLFIWVISHLTFSRNCQKRWQIYFSLNRQNPFMKWCGRLRTVFKVICEGKLFMRHVILQFKQNYIAVNTKQHLIASAQNNSNHGRLEI